MSNVLVLPPAVVSPSMAWQLDTGMQFKQVYGYVGFPPYNEREWFGFLNDLAAGSTGPQFGNNLAAFCATHRVNYILIGPGTPSSLVAAVAAQHWPQRVKLGVTVTQVPPPSLLAYNYIEGDYWASPAPLNWIGRRVVIHTHGTPTVLTLSGQWRLAGEPVDITLTNGSDISVYRITRSDTKAIQLPANATIVLTASSTFVPAQVIHNGDPRPLSVAISLQQTEKTRAANEGTARVPRATN